MRFEMEEILKKELRALAVQTRRKLALTQREMSELLYMSETSYSDIETGRYMCGSLTTVLLLLEQDNPNEFLSMIKSKFDELNLS